MDRNVDDLWNSHDKHNREINHLVHVQLGNLNGQTNSLDHGTPKRHDRDDDDDLWNPHDLHMGTRSPWSRATGESQWSDDLCATTGIDEERENVRLVHTGHDAEHYGPANQGRDTS